MTAYMTPGNVYYEGERQAPEHIEVPARPGPNFDWDFETGAWAENNPSPVSSVYPAEAVLQSPNGTPFKVMVDDDGNLETEPVEESNGEA